MRLSQRRSRCVLAVALLLALAGCIVASNAAPMMTLKPFARKTREYDAAEACAASPELMECQAPIPRGGGGAAGAADVASGMPGAAARRASTAAAAASTESLGPVVGALVSLRTTASSSLAAFWSDAEQLKFLLAGAVAGIVSRTVVSPLEVVATAQMVRGGEAGTLAELSTLFKAEGMKGFFKGNGANCLKVAPTRGVQFLAFESFKARLVEWKRQHHGLPADADVALAPWERLVAGGFAGMIASSMVYPLEVVKTMLTMYPGKYPGIGAAFRGVLAEAGPSGFYKGLAPTLVAMFPYVGVEFMFYETAKIFLEALLQERQDESGISNLAPVVLPTIVSLGLGAIAGAAAQTGAHPLDVVRKRLQIQGINGNPILYKTTVGAFSGIAKKEGIGALYKGLRPACFATIPGTGVAYIVYESMKKYLGLTSV